MNLVCVNSGSNGNCYLIEKDRHFLSLDAGCRWKEVQIACGFQVSAIDACLISHEHC